MSSNIGPEAQAKYGEFLDAKTLEDRIRLLTEFISIVPKHKATEKIVALNKTRLKKLQQELADETERKKAQTSGAVDPFSLKKDSNQIMVALISEFNEHGEGAGKSRLLQYLTGVREVVVGQYTSIPVIGSYNWNNVRFQLVEVPALQDSQNIRRIMQAIRHADFIFILVDMTRDAVGQVDRILSMLYSYNIVINREKPEIHFKKTGSGGTQIIYNSASAKQSHIYEQNILNYASFLGKNLIIKINDYVSPLDIKFAFSQNMVFKHAYLVATKGDLPNTQENFLNLIIRYGLDENSVVGFDKEKIQGLVSRFGKEKEWEKKIAPLDESSSSANSEKESLDQDFGKENVEAAEKTENVEPLSLDQDLSQTPDEVEGDKQIEDYSISQIDDFSYMGEIEGVLSEADKKIDMINEEDYLPLFKIFPCAITYTDEGKEIKKGLQNFPEHILKDLELIRIFTKSKSGVDDRPMIVKKGASVEDIAVKIHKSLIETFRFAFIYREGDTHKKKRVGLNYPLEDLDILEIFS